MQISREEQVGKFEGPETGACLLSSRNGEDCLAEEE